MKELSRQMEEIQTEPHNITVYFDGGYDLKTRTSGLGCAIYYEQNEKAYRLRKNARVEELESNNEAEYAACHLALQELEYLDVHHLPVTITGDSLVVIMQLKGEWPCYEPQLSRWADRIDNLISRMGIDPEFNLVSRKRIKKQITWLPRRCKTLRLQAQRNNPTKSRGYGYECTPHSRLSHIKSSCESTKAIRLCMTRRASNHAALAVPYNIHGEGRSNG